MSVGKGKLLTLINDLSNLSSHQSSDQQTLETLDLSIQEILNFYNMDMGFLSFNLKISDPKKRNFARSIGLPVEQSKNLVKELEEEISKGLGGRENDFVFNLEYIVNRKTLELFELTKIKSAVRVPLLSSDVNEGIMCLFSKDVVKFETEELEMISAIGGFIANTYVAKRAYLNAVAYVNDKQKYFDNLFNSVLVLDEDLFVIDVNRAGQELLGKYPRNETFQLNMASFISPDHFTSVLGILDDLKVNEISKEVSVKWILDPDSDDTNSVQVVFGFTKMMNSQGFTSYIASGRIIQLRESLAIQSRTNVDFDLITRLDQLKRRYFQDSDTALSIIKKEFFPAAYVCIVNEETGPLPLVSSPKSNLMDVMQEVIGLMAGLNTNEIVNQVYVAGSTPWTKPKGEFRWIAFKRDNPEARGSTEFHLIGLVVIRNLTNVSPQLTQLLFGILLGAMNDYLNILDEDKVDLITKAYDGNSYFSSISLITNTLSELREFSSELFAATLSGLETL